MARASYASRLLKAQRDQDRINDYLASRPPQEWDEVEAIPPPRRSRVVVDPSAPVEVLEEQFAEWREREAERVCYLSEGEAESWRDWIGQGNRPDRATRKQDNAARDERARVFEDFSGARFGRTLPRPDLDDLKRWASERARVANGIANATTDALEKWCELQRYAALFGIDPPPLRPMFSPDLKPIEPNGRDSFACGIRRMLTAKWWKARGREAAARRSEARAIRDGATHRFAQSVCSDEAVRWSRLTRETTRQLCINFELCNENQDTYSLEAAIAASVANPELRRNEAMTRLKGYELTADHLGWVGLFITWTLPSRFHSRLSSTGERNKAWRGAMPNDGQAELCEQWTQARALLAQKKIEYCGMRVAEPHHDGTPHWHILIFCHPGSVGALLAVLEAKALEESPNEPGAREHRFTCEMIDRAKGSALAYVSKYIAKNIDGAHLTAAHVLDDAGKMIEAECPAPVYAERVLAWARAWRIRQFQFFGFARSAPVTVYRELRRIREPEQLELQLIAPHREAADAGDFAGFIDAMKREPVALWLCDPAGPFTPLTETGSAAAAPVQGLRLKEREGAAPTRFTSWQLIRRGGDRAGPKIARPWTRVNNCNSPVPPDSFPDVPPDNPPDRAAVGPPQVPPQC